MWCIERQVADQSFGKALHREFCRRICSIDRGPEAIHAAGVDDVGFIGPLQQRQKCPRAIIDAVPADVKRLLPFRTIAIDEASAKSADPGIVEQKMDMIGVEIAGYGLG